MAAVAVAEAVALGLGDNELDAVAEAVAHAEPEAAAERLADGDPEALADAARYGKATPFLVDQVRQRLGAAIAQRFVDAIAHARIHFYPRQGFFMPPRRLLLDEVF